MGSRNAKRPLLERLALRAAGQRAPVEPPAWPVATLAPFNGEIMTRAGALKRFAAVGALSLLPLRLMEQPAEAKRDCFNPCLGLVKAAADRDLGKCRPHVFDFMLSAGVGPSVWCMLVNAAGMENYRRECYKPDCGDLGKRIREGGHIKSLPVVKLDLPAGTQAECENCESVGGYCGVCPQGSPGFTEGKNPFFCGTPPVLPCRYCGGC